MLDLLPSCLCSPFLQCWSPVVSVKGWEKKEKEGKWNRGRWGGYISVRSTLCLPQVFENVTPCGGWDRVFISLSSFQCVIQTLDFSAGFWGAHRPHTRHLVKCFTGWWGVGMRCCREKPGWAALANLSHPKGGGERKKKVDQGRCLPFPTSGAARHKWLPC